MKKISLISTFLMSFNMFAGNFDLGVMVGGPTGLSAKYTLNSSNFIQAGLSSKYSFTDYMWVSKEDFNVDKLQWSYGAGLAVKSGVGARAATNFEYNMYKQFNCFADVAFNGLTDSDGFSTSLTFALGARYSF